jgi:hypothetical protein
MRNPDTYAQLVDSLASNLPDLGYQRTGDSRWWRSNAEIRAYPMDGRDAATKHILRSDVVLVLNDPNSVPEWAMDRGLPARLDEKTKGVRVMSCMGFNAFGIKRGPLDRGSNGAAASKVSARIDWYGLIEDMTGYLPGHHDLMLVTFIRDDSQWAYLFSTPDKWRAKRRPVSTPSRAQASRAIMSSRGSARTASGSTGLLTG